MRRVGVVGVGQLPFKVRYEDKTSQALGFEATKKALDDAGITAKDIDAVTYSIYTPVMMRQEAPDMLLHDHLGLNGKPSLRVSAGAASGGFAMYAAYAQVASGTADIALLLGVQKGMEFYSADTKSRWDGFRRAGLSTDLMWLDCLGAGGPSGLTSSLCVVPHMEKYGTPTEVQIAKASVKNHKNALVNPNAQLKLDLTVEDVLNSRIIAWPITMYECCLYSDGAAALILAAEDVATEISKAPIWVTGVGISYHSLWNAEPRSLGRLWGVAEAAERAYTMASIKDPMKEMDVVELHDLTSGVEVLTYEELGLCALGDGGRLLDEGIVEKDGALPVNPSGGRVACGHVAAVSEVSSTCDVVLQLREQAGNIQVPISKGKGMVECICGVASFCAVTTFEREA